MPATRGTWPAFWLTNDPLVDEVDFADAPVSQSEKPEWYAFGTPFGNGGAFRGTNEPGPGRYLGQNSHGVNHYGRDSSIRGLETEIAGTWTDDEICWWNDGQRFACQDFRWGGVPGHLILNLAVGGGGWIPHDQVDSSGFPTSFDVDYVRVYKG
jgi:beta-glucanase (GH16 family)